MCDRICACICACIHEVCTVCATASSDAMMETGNLGHVSMAVSVYANPHLGKLDKCWQLPLWARCQQLAGGFGVFGCHSSLSFLSFLGSGSEGDEVL